MVVVMVVCIAVEFQLEWGYARFPKDDGGGDAGDGEGGA